MTDTKNLPTREPTGEEKKIIDQLLSLYQARPTPDSYAFYDE